ncbi:hypothetical protein JCM3775_004998 [Rhodotorula graminis]
MSSMRKAVDGATKPKRAAPKAKYIDPLVQATFQQDGQLQEVVRTLASRMRDPNTTVVFKSLIVLHTLMRSGSIDSVFPYLASSSVSLSLSSSEAANVAAYGQYLAVRIKAFGTLKRDAIRDKSDRRNAARMRKLSVEQGLLRETREVQRMIAALVEAKFYADSDVDDDVSMTALRLLVKDLLVLFTVVNEGVINLLENFFALSKPDCDMALKIYKTFCRDTERVVAYLGTAKKLYNVLNIPIPNLKHAPLSLANSLEEYVRDPNFERNREEYKEVKRIADGGAPRSTPPRSSSPAHPSSSSAAPATSTSTSPSAPAAAAAAPPKSFTDFFDSIETAQTPMFAGGASPAPPHVGMFPQATGGFNPFIAPQPTGMPTTMMMGSPFGMVQQPQMTGFNPFLQQLQPQQTGYATQMLQSQGTGFGGGFGGAQGLAPHMTGQGQGQGQGQANPFRQSMMMTGAAPGGNPFGMGMVGTGPLAPPVGQGQARLLQQATGNPFGQPGQQQQFAPPPSSSSSGGLSGSTAPGAPPLGAPTSPFHASSFPQHPFSSSSSTPTPTSPSSSAPGPGPAPLVAQKTGARNPFAPAPGTVIPHTAPPQPKQPSMYELAHLRQQQTGFQGSSSSSAAAPAQGQAQANGVGSPFGQPQAQPQQQSAPPPKQDAFSAFLAQQQAKRDAEAAGGAQHGGATPLIAQKTGGLMASVASDLAASSGEQSQPQGASSSPFGFAFPGSNALNGTGNGGAPASSSSLSTPFSSLSLSTSTSALSPSLTGAHSYTASPLSAQPTGGFSSVRAFQPSSSFGNKLASEISASALSPQATGFGNGGGGGAGVGGQAQQSAFSSQSSQPSQQQQPLQQQPTGFNPFGGTRLPPLNSPLSAGATTQPTGTGGGYGGSGGFGGAGGSGGVATASLI